MSPIYKQKLPSGKTRLFVKGQHKGVGYWKTVNTLEEGERYETAVKSSGPQLKRTLPQDIKLIDYIKSDYLPYCQQVKPGNYINEMRVCKRAILPYFADMTLFEIDPRTVRAWQRTRLGTDTVHGRPRKTSTVNREIAVLSQIFTLAVNDEIIERNPCAKVKRFADEPHRISYLTHEEEARLLAACTGVRAYLKDFLIVGIYTGLRPGKSELLGLRVEQCDFANEQIVLEKHKTAKRTGMVRIIPMNSRVQATLINLCDGKQGQDYVFTQQATGKPYRQIIKPFKSASKFARLPEAKRIPYVMRHTFGTRLAQAGVGIAEIKDLMGHRDIKMTMRYVHPAHEKKREAVERLVAKA